MSLYIFSSRMLSRAFVLIIVLQKYSLSVDGVIKSDNEKNSEMEEHTLVTDSEVFPFVAAILKMSTYISAGALINDNWVLTAADALYTMRESTRMLRIRLGSINYKKGGTLVPIKFFEIHPYFDDTSPVYDVALIKLPNAVRFTYSLRSIRLQKDAKEVYATHFIVTSWVIPLTHSDESYHIKSMEEIKRRRILSVTHLHPTDSDDCYEELTSIGINDTETIMCLDTGVMAEPCMRDVGAPVVLNNVLWGIISSWRPSDCENDLAGPTFATLVSAPAISSWIHAVINGHVWHVMQHKHTNITHFGDEPSLTSHV